VGYPSHASPPLPLRHVKGLSRGIVLHKRHITTHFLVKSQSLVYDHIGESFVQIT
jgi:hypothetical protein